VVYVDRGCDVDALLCLYGYLRVCRLLHSVYVALDCRLNYAGVWYMSTEGVMLMHSCVCTALVCM